MTVRCIPLPTTKQGIPDLALLADHVRSRKGEHAPVFQCGAITIEHDREINLYLFGDEALNRCFILGHVYSKDFEGLVIQVIT